MATNLLEDLLAVGEQMKKALDGGETDAYLELLEKRGTLLDAISAYPHPSEIDPNWKTTAAALSGQHDQLVEAAEAQCRRMQEALTRMKQVEGARRSYRQASGRRNILNENLRA